MKKLALVLLLATAPWAPAAIISVEFRFTPFRGDPETAKNVTTLPGKAAVFINNVPFSEEEVHEEAVPVLLDEHEVSPAVAVPLSSAGAVLRKGKNKIRLEFTPNDAAKSYRAQLRWSSTTDEASAEVDGESGLGASQTGGGVDDRKEVKGKVVFEREFEADFALDLPWHHYPPVASLSPEDKQKITALLKLRAEWFQPNFAALYQAIEENESLKADDVRRAQCLEAAYRAGVRVPAPAESDLDFVTTGGPEVIVTRKGGSLFGLDEKTLAAVKDEDAQICAGMVLATVYPGRLGFVRKPDGAWETVE